MACARRECWWHALWSGNYIGDFVHIKVAVCDMLLRLPANRGGDFVFIARADDRVPAIDHFLIYLGD